MRERIKNIVKILMGGGLQKLAFTVIKEVRNRGRLALWGWKDDRWDPAKHYKKADCGLEFISLQDLRIDPEGISQEKAQELWRMYRQHRFDLLGSGWVYSDFDHDVSGVEGIAYESLRLKADRDGAFLKQTMKEVNLRHAREIYHEISEVYRPIDWQKDFKSGYRWGAHRWFRPQEVAKKVGGDIKVPWELSRLQHLPRFVLLYQLLPEERDEIYREFRDQLLDFIAQNPVRMGVNHMCTMDVGIRVANIALACSLWHWAGKNFDRAFERIVTDYLFQECDFIRKNLEWSYYLTSNHYFADIAGLLWGSAILPACRARKRWLRFARKQIVREIQKQFYEEGSNGEGSVAYHRLTAEMALYSVALIHRLSLTGAIRDAGEDIYERLEGAGFFMDAVGRPDGMFTQIGDNDSGLFFRLSITGELIDAAKAGERYRSLESYRPSPEDRIYLDENMNDGRTLVSAMYGMFEAPVWEYATARYPFEASFMKALLLDKKGIGWRGRIDREPSLQKRGACPIHRQDYVVKSNGVALREGLSRIDYPAFGVYVFRSANLYLCFNASDNGQKGNGGHAHNDKLSFELFIGKTCVFEDPGNYVYTPFPDLRDQYRGTRYHNTVYCGEEQNRFNGLFSMENDTRCYILDIGENYIEAQVEYREIVHRRKVEILDDRICVTDWCNKAFAQQFGKRPVARGYGKLER